MLRAGITWQGQVQLGAFCVFEFCVGLFWPSMMKQRAAHVPEEMRATIINFFRIPLNLFVCIVLYNVRWPVLDALQLCHNNVSITCRTGGMYCRNRYG